jgi:hypothetical protein
MGRSPFLNASLQMFGSLVTSLAKDDVLALRAYNLGA